jgi:hypothetical protein
MPRAQLTDDQILDEGEKLFLERAKAYYRELRQVAQNAPVGKIINRADAFAFEKGRELVQQSLECIVQEQNDVLEKKKNSGNATADANGDISDTAPTTR